MPIVIKIHRYACQLRQLSAHTFFMALYQRMYLYRFYERHSLSIFWWASGCRCAHGRQSYEDIILDSSCRCPIFCSYWCRRTVSLFCVFINRTADMQMPANWQKENIDLGVLLFWWQMASGCQLSVASAVIATVCFRIFCLIKSRESFD